MYIILCVLFIICERCYGYEDVIDIPEITTEPTAMISRASGLKITLHCKWPRIQRSVTYQLVYANENVTLNSSTGNDLTYTLKSSCRNSGRYVCRSVGLSVEASEDRRLDFLITDCNPRMCSDSEYIKTVSASTGSQVAVTYCVIASEADVTVPQLRAFRTLGVRQSSLQDKINFTFTALSGISYELSVNICNVTVEDYGEVNLEIISLQRSLRFELQLLPIGAVSQYFNYTKKDQLLSCRSSWYPCVVVISKGHSGQILNSVNNTILKNEMVLLNATLPQATCGDMGIYKCVITDFRGVNVVKEIFVDPDKCSPRLCEHKEDYQNITLKLSSSAGLKVCIMGRFDSRQQNVTVSVFRNTIPFSRFTTDLVITNEFYHYVKIQISDIKAADSGQYNMDVIANTFNISTIFNIFVERPPVLCNNTHNDITINVKHGQYVNVSFCVHTSGSVAEVRLNRKSMIISEKPHLNSTEHVNLNRTSHDTLELRIRLPRVRSQMTWSYIVSIITKLGHTFLYRFHLNITGNLTLCEGEAMSKTVKVRLGSTAVVHFCVTTDLDLGSHIGINNLTYAINRFNGARDKIGVTSHRKDNSDTTDHYLQMYIQNVTEDDIVQYVIRIKPTVSIDLTVIVDLRESDDAYPKGCSDRQPRMYTLADIGEAVTVDVCVVTMWREGNDVIHHINILNANKQTLNVNVTNFTRKLDNNSISDTLHVIQAHFWNITSQNFARYDVSIEFANNVTWRSVFYIVNRKDSVSCPPTLCSKVSKLLQHSHQQTFCLSAYGQTDDRLQVNSNLYMIQDDSGCSECRPEKVDGNVSLDIRVFSWWSHVTSRRYVIVLKDKVPSDKLTLKVEFLSADVVYSFSKNPEVQVSDETTTDIMSRSTDATNTSYTLSPAAVTGIETIHVSSAEPIPLLLIAVVFSVLSFLMFTVLVCITVVRGRHSRRSVSRRKSSEKSVTSLGEVSRLLNTTQCSQDTGRCLLNLDESQPPRKTSADYSILSGEYITPLDL
ncbi:hypothetical protein BgiMline_031359 [Biomphalaria glabrata]